MKTESFLRFNRWASAGLCVAFLLLAAAGARAGFTLEMDVIRYDVNGWYFSPNLMTNNTPPSVPFGHYNVTSYDYPTNGASALYQFDTNGFNSIGGGPYGYGDFNSMVYELTNGTWSIFVTNAVVTNVYHFTVGLNLDSNGLPTMTVTYPPNGATAVTNQPVFTWQGPTNYSDLAVYDANSSSYLPVTQTNWSSPNMLLEGLNTFTVHYDYYSTTTVVASVPLDAGLNPISSWISTSHLQDYISSTFTVGTVDTSGTAHTLVAHYPFDATSGPVLAAAVDTAGNAYNLTYSGSYGAQGGADLTADSAAGVGAVQFNDGDGNSAGYLGWTNPTPPALLSALAGSFSVACWIKTTQNNFGWDQAPAYYGAGIVSADVNGLANDVIPIALTGDTIGFNTGGSEDDTLNSTASVNDGNYHHIVVTRNQQTGQKIIYIDGAFDSFSSGTTNLLDDPQKLTLGALADAGNPDPNDGSYYNGYNGDLDDLQIYSGVLSASEVAHLFANPGATVANGGGNYSGGHTNIAHYALDNSGFLGEDTSGNGNDMDGESWWGPVHQFSSDAEAGGGAVQFFGASCLTPDGSVLTNWDTVLGGSFTISAWVNTTNTLGNPSDDAVNGASLFWAYNDHANTNDTIPIALTGGYAAFSTRDHLGNGSTLHSTTSVNDGQYHLITVTRNQSSGQKSLYVDGSLQANEVGTTEPLNGNNYFLSVGGTTISSYTGLADDVQIYSGVLSATEVASLYANPGTTIPDLAGGNPNGLVVHYDFDEGTVLSPDVSGNNNNVVYAGNFGGSGPSISSDTVAGAGSVSFDGGSYLTASSNLLATLAGEFTVSLWLKTSQNFGSQGALAWQGAGVLAADSPDAGAKDLIPVALTGGQVAFNIGNGVYDDTLNSSATVNNGAWHHVVVTRSLSTGNRQIFIDGALDSSEVSSTVLLNSPVLLTIGAKADASNPDPTSPDYTGSNGYQGLLDDLQIYDRVLSASEVTYLYNNPGAVATNSVTTPTLTVSASPQSGLAPLTVQFTSPSVDSAGNTVTNWNWSFGDGGTSTAQSPSYTYATAGSFSPSLTAISTYGATPLVVNGLGVILVTNVAPSITVNPFDQTNYPGYNVALLAEAAGVPPPTWQWFKTGAGLIIGATNNLYIPTNSGSAAVAGSYYAIASNLVGTANSTTALVSFVSAPLPPDWSVAYKNQVSNPPLDSTTNDNIACLLDATGTNIYTVGSIVGTNYFGADPLITADGVYESLFLKQTTAGTALWGRSITNNGNGSSYAECVAAAPGGGIYAAGDFFGTNWLGTNKLVDVAGGSTYVVRFDANGNALWIQTITGTNGNFTEYHDLTSDPSGNVTLSALISGGTRVGTSNVFVSGQVGVLAQFDANGNLRWWQLPSGWPTSLTYNSGCIYGSMGGGSTNYIGGVTNLSDRREAVFSINATNGQGNWVRGVAAQNSQGNPYGFIDDEPLVAVSGTNVFVAGIAWGSNAMFGAYTVTFPVSKGEYLARYDTNGNAQLATTFGSEYTWPWSMQADAAGNVYIGSDFDTYSIFGNDVIAAPFYATVQSLGSLAPGAYIPGQTCVAKFDRNGNPLWARLAESGSSYLNSRDIALASDGVWSCGFFSQQSVFDSITINGAVTCIGTPTCTPQYHPSGYLAKITDSTAAAAPVTLLNPQVSGPSFQFSFASQSGFTNAVQYRTNLNAGLNWQTYSNVPGDGTLKTVPIPLSVFNPARQAFIRVLTQ